MKRAPLLLLVLVVAGCSSVSVSEEEVNVPLSPLSRPVAVYVRPFEVPRGVEFDAASRSPGDDARSRLGRAVAESAVARAARLIGPAHMLARAAAPPAAGLLVEGKILRVRQGSRALRLAIGFGAGRSRFETSVKVYNLERSRTDPWLAFETAGGSNMEPGLVGLLVPSPASIPVALTVVGGVAAAGAVTAKGVTEDAARTGRTIASAVQNHLASAGVERKKATPKRPGRLRTPFGDIPVLPAHSTD